MGGKRFLLKLFLIRAFVALLCLLLFQSPAQAQVLDQIGSSIREGGDYIRDQASTGANGLRDYGCRNITSALCRAEPEPEPEPEPDPDPDPEPVPPPFTGGQCPSVLYRATYTLNNYSISLVDGSRMGLFSTNLSFLDVLGPVTSAPTIVWGSVNTGSQPWRDQDFSYVFSANGQPVFINLAGATSRPGSQAYPTKYEVVDFSVARLDGEPDICGDPPSGSDGDGSDGDGSGGDGTGGDGTGGDGTGGDGTGGDGTGGDGTGGDGTGGDGTDGTDGGDGTGGDGTGGDGTGGDGSGNGGDSTPPGDGPAENGPPDRPPECPESGLDENGDPVQDADGNACPLPDEPDNGDDDFDDDKKCGGRSDLGGYALCRFKDKFPFDFLDLTEVNLPEPSCPQFYFFGQGLEFCFVNDFLQAFVVIVWIAFLMFVMPNL